LLVLFSEYVASLTTKIDVVLCQTNPSIGHHRYPLRMIRGEFVVDNAVLLVSLSTEATPDEIAILITDQFALIIACQYLHFGDPHHEMNGGLAAPIIFRVAGPGGCRERGEAEGEDEFFLHGTCLSSATPDQRLTARRCYRRPFWSHGNVSLRAYSIAIATFMLSMYLSNSAPGVCAFWSRTHR